MATAGSGPGPTPAPPDRPLSVVIAGGGTGGHLYPAIALARALATPDPQHPVPARVRLIGTRAGPEGGVAAASGIAFEGIDVIGLRRSASPRNLVAGAKGAAATLRAARLLRRAGADVVVGTGAYVSVPVALAAALLRIPLVLHDANAVPGVANRLAGRWAAAVAVSFPEAGRWFKVPVTLTGNPIRPELARLVDPAVRADLRPAGLDHFGLEAGRTTLLVFGGSQGARRINEAALGTYDRWRDEERLQVLHLVGPRELPASEARLGALRREGDRIRWRLVGSTHRMDLAYSVADLTVCRAGAATLFEVAVAGVPAIVVPYPYATADHQRANTQPLVELQAVELLLDADCTPDRLAAMVEALAFDGGKLAGMHTALKTFARPDATAALADLVRTVGARRGSAR